MSWHFSQALAEEYLEADCSDGERFAPLNTKPMPQVFLSPDRMKAFSRLSRYGMTFEPLTESHGEELLMWFLADFRVRTSAQQEEAQESTETDQDCGRKWHALSVKFDRDTSSWRIHHSLFPEDLPESSVTLPRWGLMRDGELWELTMSAHLTSETGYGLLPTPTATNARQGVNSKAGGKSQGKPLLPMAAMMWPTPVASEAGAGARTPDGKRGARLTDIVKRPDLWPTPCATEARQGLQIRRSGKKGKQQSLSTAVRIFPTPTASMHTIQDLEQARYHSSKRPPYQECYPTPAATDWKTGYRTDTAAGKEQREKRSKPLRDHQAPGGQLNPTWVEWLMGWPLGWTDLRPLVMDRSL
jgi:hypothetical protein